jgi:hypothetical protein
VIGYWRSEKRGRWTVATNVDGPYQKSESDSPFWIVKTPDGKFAVQEYVEPRRTVLDELTQSQAERLQVYLTDFMDSYDKLNNTESTLLDRPGRRKIRLED